MEDDVHCNRDDKMIKVVKMDKKTREHLKSNKTIKILEVSVTTSFVPLITYKITDIQNTTQ